VDCEICYQSTNVPLRKCQICDRHFHHSSCGGTFTWFEEEVSDFDIDDYMRGHIAGRTLRRREFTQEQCIVCHRNEFGRHGVAPGQREWHDALAVYLDRPDLLSEQFQEKARQAQQRNRERQRAAAQAAAEAAACARQKLDYAERRHLHFSPLIPLAHAWNETGEALRLLESELSHARSEAEKALRALESEKKYREEAKDLYGWLDDRAEEIARAETQLADLTNKTESLANRIVVMRHEVDRVENEYRTCRDKLLLAWRHTEGESDLRVSFGILGLTYDRSPFSE
jgi:hypothetical protein